MAHPAVYVVSIGLVIGTLLYSLFANRPQAQHSYRRSNKTIDDFRVVNEQCSICLNDITCERAKTILNCGHNFHTVCVAKWIRYKDECPNCRERVQ